MATELNTVDELMTAERTAAMLGLRVQTLAAWRSTGRGSLRFVRLGTKAIRYRRADVLAWLERQSATSCAALDAATN